MTDSYEILAPAGSMEDLKEILLASPDAIYVGLAGHSSRPSFSDLHLEEIKIAIAVCHEHGVRIHIAINAKVSEGDFENVVASIMKLDAWGADAVIISDLGLIRALQGRLNNLEIHASTLMAAMNVEAARVLNDLGVSRIVFYANLYFDEIAAITAALPDLDYELVAEGGTCFNDIRRCRLPHFYQDGEQKLCCRCPFEVVNEDASTFLSREISEYPTTSAEIIGLFMAIGIRSFKIEGRTVSARERAPMVNRLRKSISAFQAGSKEGLPLQGYLHYFTREVLDMR